MTTIAKAYSHVNQHETVQSVSLSTGYDRFIKKLEFSHYGLVAMAILIGSCLGSIATMKIFQNHAGDWQFIVSLGFTMANLVACIGQAPTKWVVNLFAASLFVNALLLVINII
jgi:hypothetical protein